jgi:hypothetical protein
MAYIARRDGDALTLTCVGGDLTILHEAPNGVLVVSWPSRRYDGTELPVRYALARLLTGDEAVKARGRTLCNSAHYASYPDVFTELGLGDEARSWEKRVAGRDWRAARAEMVALAEAYTD